MKSQYRTIFAFIALLLVVSLACNGGATPTPAPTIPPAPTSAPLPTIDTTQQQGNAPSGALPQSGNAPQQSGTSSDLVTFVDENNLLAFDLPGDWFYEHTVGDVLYVDTFTSPDEVSAIIESLVYNDGTAFTGKDNGRFALYLLNTYYSATGKEGDIRVSSDQIMNDGSERLEWASRSGGFSGVSYFELRGDDRKTFLMLTAKWLDDLDQATLDAINNAINSYYIP